MPCITHLEPRQSVEQMEFEFKTHEIRIDATFDPMSVCGVLFDSFFLRFDPLITPTRQHLFTGIKITQLTIAKSPRSWARIE